ncbi:MAG: hypothetical protein HYV90_01065 [Candidatus Woesebacteria bacterium]|nr:MAG: hypothetical protein HYV90_01065 [Candidatus Woesebacteria bacterium]
MTLLSDANPFGSIAAPSALSQYGTDAGPAIGGLIERVLQFLIVGAGIYALFNLVLAGYDFMAAGDDAKKVAGAWAKIYQTIIGLAFSAGAFVLAALFGQLIFGKWDFILSPSIPTL